MRERAGSTTHGGFDWRGALRDRRKEQKLSQPEVARRSGLSLSAVRSYESGGRHPSRAALTAIIDSLGMTVEQANPVLAGAGYAGNARAIFHEAYGPRPIEWFAEEVERSAWPLFVINEAADLIAANRSFRSLIGIPLTEQLPRPEKWNFIATASDPTYADRLDSWDEAMSFMIGLAKADWRAISPERPAPHVNPAYQRFLAGDPAYLTRMLKLWGPAEPVPHTTRMSYPVRWRHDNGDLMRFTATVTTADVWHAFFWVDWIPDDPETLTLLQAGRKRRTVG
jgi:transcriptional regulator with XRE-family HTH domain